MINHGRILEDRVAKVLEIMNLPYVREGSRKHYGARGSAKGKFDFWIANKIAIECKSISRACELSLPWPSAKSPKIRSHQLRALRKEHEKGNAAGLLVEVRSDERLYWLTIKGLDEIVQEHGMVAALHLELLEVYAIKIIDMEVLLNKLVNNA